MIYFDMDGVVADFNQYVNEHIPRSKPMETGDEVTLEEWSTLRQSHQRMFADFDYIPEVVDILHAVQRKHKVAFLTAIPYDNESLWQYVTMDKIHWAKGYFPGTPVFIGPYAHDKKLHCKSPSDILIDDKLSNVQEWESVHGIAHLYRNPENLRDFLVNYGIL